MKNKLFAIFGFAFLALPFIGCNSHTHVADTVWHKDETTHWHECTSGDGYVMDKADHVYNQKATDATYLASEATCTAPKKYFYSCICGQKGTTTFDSGEPLGHDYTTLEVSGDYKKDYYALDTFDTTNLKVEKVCKENDSRVDVTNDVAIEYENGDEIHGEDTKVTVTLANENLSADIEIDVTKLTPTISNFEENYATSCLTAPDLSEVTSDYGEISALYYKDEACSTPIDVEDLTVGTYYLKVMVTEDVDWESTIVTEPATLTVTHKYDEEHKLPNYDCIGSKYAYCLCESYDPESGEIVTADDIDFTDSLFYAGMVNDEETPLTYNNKLIYATENAINYKLYNALQDSETGIDDDITFRRYYASLPSIDLSKFSYVEFTLRSVKTLDTVVQDNPFTNQQKFGFENDNMQQILTSESKQINNGKVTINKVSGESKYIVTFDFEEKQFSKEITNQEIIIGVAPISFYITAHYERGFQLSNLVLKTECAEGSHSFGDSFEVNTECISNLGHECENCGVIEYFANDGSLIKLNENSYGVKLMNGTTDVSDWGGSSGSPQTKKLVLTEKDISAETWSWDMKNILLPKVNFNEIEQINFDVVLKAVASAGTPSASGSTIVQIGDQQNDAISNSTDIEGVLTVGVSPFQNSNEIWAEFFTPDTKLSYKITDEDIINGSKSFSFDVNPRTNEGTFKIVQLNNISVIKRTGYFSRELTALGFSGNPSFVDWGHNNKRTLYYSDDAKADISLNLPFDEIFSKVELWGTIGINASSNIESSIGFSNVEGEKLSFDFNGFGIFRIVIEKNGANFKITISTYSSGKADVLSNISVADFTSDAFKGEITKDVSSLSSAVIIGKEAYRKIGVQLGTFDE